MIPRCKLPTGRPIQDRFVDAAGEPTALPEDGTGQAVTLLERNGVPEAAIIHDAILLEEPGLIASVASAMRLAVENDRLTAAVEAQLAEVRASRARIVAAGDAERQRIERDLHDGAQQRLVALTLALRLARTRLGDDADPAIKLSLEQASEEAQGRALRAPRAGPRHPPPDPDRGGPPRGDRVPRRPDADDRFGRRRPGREVRPARRGDRLLRRVGVACQRRQVRRGERRAGPGRMAGRRPDASRSPMTDAAVPIPGPARACAGCSTACRAVDGTLEVDQPARRRDTDRGPDPDAAPTRGVDQMISRAAT